MQSEPQVESLRALKAQLSPRRWQARVAKAHRRLEVVEALRERCSDGVLRREALREVAPRVAWTTARRWWMSYHEREGAGWERLVDRRLPERPWETPEPWKRLVGLLARQEPPPSLEPLRQGLVETFGQEAALSDGTLRKILKERGLSARAEAREEVVELSGGGALVLLLAALEQSGIGAELAAAVGEVVAELEPAEPLRPEAPGRDEQGRFTEAYNRARRERLAEHGGLFASIEDRGGEKALGQSRLARLSPGTLEQHLRCLIVLPLLSERRGTAGVDGPGGAWLEVLSAVAYRAATLDKTLNQLKWLGAGEALWKAHARVWWQCSRRWAGEGWRQIAVYVDSSKDPWWTRRFATSGPVSRTGRVQPCLSRVVLSSGPGVPIVAEVGSGQVPLNQVLWPLLEQTRQVLGEGAVGRLTVVDAEGCQRELIEAFAADPQRDLVTVFKGPLAQGKSVEALGPWVPFGHGAVREAQVNLTPQAETALAVRVVELRRGEESTAVATRFLSTATADTLSTVEVAEAYLGRWPYQEDLFRRGRNGLGLERSAGYGAGQVTHVALLEKRESAQRRRERAEQVYAQALAAERDSAETARRRLERLQSSAEASPAPDDARHTRPAREALALYQARQQQTDQAEQRLREAEKHCQKLAEQPETIYVRDTALDSVTTCFKMVLMALLEFIAQEYLGGYRLMPRTFIESWMALPVSIRQTRHQVIYEIAPNPRDPPMTRRLEQALAIITERRIRTNGRLLVARLRADPKWADSS